MNALRRNLPLLVTGAIFCLLFVIAGLLYDGFFSPRVVTSLLGDNAFLGIAAVGMSLVIFSGGIDLSVGAVIGFASVFTATLVSRGVPPGVAWIAALLVGGGLGAFMGTLIHVFRLPAFMVTLAGMFLARGAGFWLNTESVGLTHPVYDALSGYELSLSESLHFPTVALALMGVTLAGYVVAHHTRFGRALFAIGGNEQSAVLMGLPVARTKILVYALNGVCAALAGIVATVYTGSGNPAMGVGLELDAIAIVVMGGALLTGGRGHMLGTVFGLLIFGTIQAALLFDGRLSSWWNRIVVGALLLGFILLQRGLSRSMNRK